MLTQCIFQKDWMGRCPAKTHEEFCEEHREVTCSCGNQAIKSCDVTMGPMVCGAPLCGRCRHTAGGHLRRSGDINADLTVDKALREMDMVLHHLGQLRYSVEREIKNVESAMKRIKESLEE